MTNSKDPVTPHLTYNKNSGKADGFMDGLTKREYFAAMAMQGLIAREPNSIEYIAFYAVDLADELIKALNETP